MHKSLPLLLPSKISLTVFNCVAFKLYRLTNVDNIFCFSTLCHISVTVPLSQLNNFLPSLCSDPHVFQHQVPVFRTFSFLICFSPL